MFNIDLLLSYPLVHIYFVLLIRKVFQFVNKGSYLQVEKLLSFPSMGRWKRGKDRRRGGGGEHKRGEERRREERRERRDLYLACLFVEKGSNLKMVRP